VEIDIQTDLDRLWDLTQTPELHQRWDLRFSEIRYLPRPDPEMPQEFLYETRIGFGLSVSGTGESLGQRVLESGESSSSLKFASEDRKSLIVTGSGYWRYIPCDGAIRFLTWYDYEVRFGLAGRLLDQLVFRPLMGWATAWSFDRLRLWSEDVQGPEISMMLAGVHAVARLTIAAVWMWHGIVPKLIYRDLDEQRMLLHAGLPVSALPWIGAVEILIGLLIVGTWNVRGAFVANGLLMLAALCAVALQSPSYLHAAFNPVTLNLSMIALSAVGWMVSGRLPSASRCKRRPARERA
jgi:hypothetical protein